MSLTNSPSVETYKAYAEALNALDIDRTRTMTSRTKALSVKPLKQVRAIGLHQEVRKIFVDGDDVCVLADLSIAKVPGVKLFGCGWFQVKEGKIVSIRTIFDPRPLARAKAGA
jgi:limonene-1,2-epoxide hydrolase